MSDAPKQALPGNVFAAWLESIAESMNRVSHELFEDDRPDAAGQASRLADLCGQLALEVLP